MCSEQDVTSQLGGYTTNYLTDSQVQVCMPMYASSKKKKRNLYDVVRHENNTQKHVFFILCDKQQTLLLQLSKSHPVVEKLHHLYMNDCITLSPPPPWPRRTHNELVFMYSIILFIIMRPLLFLMKIATAFELQKDTLYFCVHNTYWQTHLFNLPNP